MIKAQGYKRGRNALVAKLAAMLCAVLLCSQSAWAATFDAKVVRVSDGDTVKVRTHESCSSGKDCVGGKKEYRVRLAEIDTPESNQPFGSNARQMLTDLVYGKAIQVKQTDIDRYGRLVAHLYMSEEGVWINAELVRTGAAWVYRRYAKSPELFQLEDQARAAEQGLWSLPEAERIPPWEWRQKNK